MVFSILSVKGTVRKEDKGGGGGRGLGGGDERRGGGGSRISYRNVSENVIRS